MRFMKFLPPEVALYLHKFTMQPCIEYCTVLQIKVFQLAGNYKAKVKTSESSRKQVKNQLGIWGSYGGGTGQRRGKFGILLYT